MTEQPGTADSEGVRKMDLDLKQRIQQMVEEEPDIKVRVQLMLMARVVDFLGDNIKAVRSIMSEFKGHEKNLEDFQEEFHKHLKDHEVYADIVNQGKGGWKVAAAASLLIGVLINVLISTLYVTAVNDISDLKSKSIDLLVEVERLKSSRREGIN